MKPIERRPHPSHDAPNSRTQIPHAAQARLLLHSPEADPQFMAALSEALPDETAHLAYLNHLAWQVRS